jgi:hypothetical protein
MKLTATHLAKNSSLSLSLSLFLGPQKGILPYSKQPATQPLPEQDELNRHNQTLFNMNFNLILQSRSRSLKRAISFLFVGF